MEGGARRSGSASRRKALAVYIIMILLAVPIWWKATEVYRAYLPFDSLPETSAVTADLVLEHESADLVAFIRLGHEILRGMLKTCKSTESFEQFNHSVATLILWQELQAIAEDGDGRCQGFLAAIGAKCHKLQHVEKDEQQSDAFAQLRTLLQTATTLEEVRPAFQAYAEATSSRLTHKDGVISPCLSELEAQDEDLTSVMRAEVLTCIWDRPDFGWFVRSGLTVLETLSEGEAKARSWLHALRSLCTQDRWARVLPHVRSGLSGALFARIDSDLDLLAQHKTIPTLTVRLEISPLFHKSGNDDIAIKAAKWMTREVNRRISVSEQIRVQVSGDFAREDITMRVDSDEQIDDRLAAYAIVNEPNAISIHVLPAGTNHKAKRSKDGKGKAANCLTMGKGPYGWVYREIPKDGLDESDERLEQWLDGVPDQLVAISVGRKAREEEEEGGKVTGFVRGGLRLSFTLLVGGERRGRVGWAAAEVLQTIFGKLSQSLSNVYDITVDTQVQHYASLAVAPTKSKQLGAYVLTADTLNDFLSSESMVLDMTSSTVRTLNFLLYVPSPDHSPLKLLDSHGAPLEPAAFLVEGFGGVYVMEAMDKGSLNRAGGGFLSAEQLAAPVASFVGQTRKLLGIGEVRGGGGDTCVVSVPDARRGVVDWELRLLEREMARFRIRSARATLGSLKALIESIPVMVVHDAIAETVAAAIDHVRGAEDAWSDGNFSSAAVIATRAVEASEEAFFDPSMESLLYFPDDHKLAVYIPYFVPVLIPVMMALLREMKRPKTEPAEDKSE